LSIGFSLRRRFWSLLKQAYSLVPSLETVMGRFSGEDLKMFSQSAELPKDLLELKDEAPGNKIAPNALFLEAVRRGPRLHIEPIRAGT